MNTEQNLELFIECKDHSVSGEKFQLLHDKECDMLITSPKPKDAELGKYYESEDYISHTDSKRSFFEKIYHMVKIYSLNKKVRLIFRLNKKIPGTLLDIGAGTGDFLVVAQKAGWNVFGTEPNLQAKSLAKQKGINLDKDTSVYQSGTFDSITMWHVLEHVPNLDDQILEIKRLLKPGGNLIVAVPNFKSYDAGYYNEFWAAYDVPRHLWHFSKTAIKKLFIKENITLQKVLPMNFDSFYVSLLSEKYKNGKMNFLKSFCVGLMSNISGMRTKQFSSHIYILKK